MSSGTFKDLTFKSDSLLTLLCFLNKMFVLLIVTRQVILGAVVTLSTYKRAAVLCIVVIVL